MTHLETALPLIIGIAILVAFVWDLIIKANKDRTAHLQNDLSNDYTRWSPSDIAIAGYIGIFLQDEVRLNSYFRALVYSVLKRSDRAVDEKIRRIATVGSDKSDASVADQDIAFILANYSNEDAEVNFLNDLYTAGASKRQVQEIKAYL